MAEYLDVCRYTPTAGGTTDWTFSAAVTGYQSPSAAGVVNGTTYRYRAESTDLTQWEVGYGTYTTATGVLARTTVLFNSSGTTSKINFSAIPQVAIVALAEDIPSLTKASNTFTGDLTVSGTETVTTGLNLGGTYRQQASPSVANGVRMDTSITIAGNSNGICAPTTSAGIILLSDVTSSGIPAAFYMWNLSSATLIGGGAGHLWSNTTTPAASTFGFAGDGSNYRIYNGFASSVNFRALTLSIA